MNVFKGNGYPENFINNCFKAFLDKKYRMQEKGITITKEPLFLALPYLGPLSLQTRTKLKRYSQLLQIIDCFSESKQISKRSSS